MCRLSPVRYLHSFLSALLLFSFFHSSAQVWQKVDDFLGFHRDDGTAFVIGNKAYCGTGVTPWFAPLADFQVYDMGTGNWNPIAPLPTGKERQYATAFSANGRGYVFGGVKGNTSLNDLWEYNPVSDTWTEKTALPDSGRNGAISFVINSVAYIVGGRTATANGIDEVWAYSPASDSWQKKKKFPFGARWRASGTSQNGKGYLTFGVDRSAVYHNGIYEYNPQVDSWVKLTEFPGAGRAYHASQVINNQLVVMAGLDSAGTYLNDLWRFNPADTSWAQLNPLPAQGCKGGISFTNGTDLYYTTGIDSTNTRLKETWKCSNPVIGLLAKPLVEFKVYPNPTRDFINIKLLDHFLEKELRVSTYTMQGKLVMKERLEWPYRLGVESLESGMYVLKIEITEGEARTVIYKF